MALSRVDASTIGTLGHLSRVTSVSTTCPLMNYEGSASVPRPWVWAEYAGGRTRCRPSWTNVLVDWRVGVLGVADASGWSDDAPVDSSFGKSSGLQKHVVLKCRNPKTSRISQHGTATCPCHKTVWPQPWRRRLTGDWSSGPESWPTTGM